MRILLTLLLSVCAINTQAQFYWAESFEYPNDDYRNRFFIDTVHYHHNIWQIGEPRKVVFDTASPLSPPNVIVTDTLHPYPPLDTSVFIITHYYTYSFGFSFNFEYQLDIDSATIAKVEVSGDSGLNWINPITQDTTYMFYWGFTKPRLDTSFHTWQEFQLNMDTWINAYPGGPDSFPHYRTSDTILFRFTFISDSDTVHHDGWMMDNFYLENAIMEGSVKQELDNNMLAVYPVPSNGNIYYNSSKSNAGETMIIVYNMKGQEVFRAQNIPASGFLNLPLPDGSYTLKYSSDKSYAVKRIVILR